MTDDPEDRGGRGTVEADDGFLRRWSRRKGAARVAGEDPRTEPRSDPGSGAQPRPAPAAPEQGGSKTAELTDGDMPPLDGLTEDSDYSGFLSPGVSEALRNAALRKLFHSSAFNVRDGLDDYDEDFRTFRALGDAITADMRHRLELAAERAHDQPSADTDGDAPRRADSAAREPAPDLEPRGGGEAEDGPERDA